MAEHDDELAQAFREGWLEPRRAVGRDVLRRAVKRGELRPDLDLDLALDCLYGPIYLRLLFGHGSLELPALEELVDQVLRGSATTHSLAAAGLTDIGINETRGVHEHASSAVIRATKPA